MSDDGDLDAAARRLQHVGEDRLLGSGGRHADSSWDGSAVEARKGGVRPILAQRAHRMSG